MSVVILRYKGCRVTVLLVITWAFPPITCLSVNLGSFMIITCLSMLPVFIAVAIFHLSSNMYKVSEVSQSIPNLYL